MKKGFIFIMIVASMVTVLGLEGPPHEGLPPATVGVGPAIAYFKNGSREFATSAMRLENAIGEIRQEDTVTLLRAKEALADCRLRYKKIEFFLQYFFRSASTVYNAPAKVEVEEPHMEYAEPTGLQVIESMLCGKEAAEHKDALAQQAGLVSNSAQDLGSLLYDFKTDDRQVLESLRFELIRVIALGITGFDAPALKSGIRESHAVLQSISEILRPYLEKKNEDGGPDRGVGGSGMEGGGIRGSGNGYMAGDSVSVYLGRSLRLLEAGSDFDSFDRMTFLTEAALPLQQYLGEWIRAMGLELNTDPALNTRAKNIFSPDAINLASFPHAMDDLADADGPGSNGSGSNGSGSNRNSLYGSSSYTAGTRGSTAAAPVNPFLIELGRRLFFERALSGNYTRNCASCHEPANYFADRRSKSLAYDGHTTVKRNAPTLLYAAYQYNQFLDGRARSLEDQVKEVIHNPTEMNADYDSVCRRLRGRPDYVSLYLKAFPHADTLSKTRTEIKFDGIATAIAAFVRTLGPRSSDFDRRLAGDKKAMTEAQVRGFNLFMGKGQCATCHFAPLFNGLTPPLYERSEFEVLGVPATEDFTRMEADRDSGRYAFFPISFYEGAFRTPGLRNSAVTAPYMHQGAFQTLEKVLDFYNRGGGAGLGMNVPLQTLSSAPLGLTDIEKNEIIDFLHALTDRLPEKF